MTSSAWVPIDPVEPNNAILLGITGTLFEIKRKHAFQDQGDFLYTIFQNADVGRMCITPLNRLLLILLLPLLPDHLFL
jgi:hypothetical protein